jgi:hypothetical protein
MSNHANAYLVACVMSQLAAESAVEPSPAPPKESAPPAADPGEWSSEQQVSFENALVHLCVCVCVCVCVCWMYVQ